MSNVLDDKPYSESQNFMGFVIIACFIAALLAGLCDKDGLSVAMSIFALGAMLTFPEDEPPKIET